MQVTIWNKNRLTTLLFFLVITLTTPAHLFGMQQNGPEKLYPRVSKEINQLFRCIQSSNSTIQLRDLIKRLSYDPHTTLNEQNETLLHFAIRCNKNCGYIEYMIDTLKFDHAIKVNDFNLLQFVACFSSCTEFFDKLITKYHFDRNVRIDNGKNILILATIYSTNLVMIKHLITKQHYDIYSNYQHCNLAQITVMFNPNIQIFLYLREIINCPLTITHLTSKLNLLQLAVINNSNPEILQYLIDVYKFDIGIRDEFGNNLLQLAASRTPHTQVIKYLIDHLGFDPSITFDNGCNLFQLAVMNNSNLPTIKYLIEVARKYNYSLELIQYLEQVIEEK